MTAAAALFGAAAAADLYETSLGTQQPQQQTPQGAEDREGSAMSLPPGLPSVVVLVAPETSIHTARVVREWGCAPVQTQWVYDCVSTGLPAFHHETCQRMARFGVHAE